MWTATVCMLVLLARAEAASPEATTAMETHLKSAYLFAYSVFQRASAGSDANLAMSTSALLDSLTMLYEGATEETERVLADVTGLPRDKQAMRSALGLVRREVKSSVGRINTYKKGTRFFVGKEVPVSDDFRSLLTSSYPSAGIEHADFSAAKATAGRINWWVKERTNGTIPTIVRADELTSDTELAIISAEYFKGLWLTPFNPNNTVELPFTGPDNQTLYTPFMFAKGMHDVVRVRPKGFTLLRLPYQGSRISLVIVLPDEDKSLNQLTNEFRDSFFLAPKLFVNSEQNCEIFVPKFTVEASLNLSPIFKKMGRLSEVFAGPVRFPAMVPNRTLSVESVTQKTRVQVDEAGATAAAAQATLIARRMMTSECYFRADRPFLFLIQQDDVPVPLFVGRVTRPQA